MRRSGRSRLGTWLWLTVTVTGALVLLASGAVAQSTDDSSPPVIGGDTSAETTTPENDPATDADADAAADDDLSEELALTGPITIALAYTGAALILIGVYMTLFGQPSIGRGRHSAPSTRLRSTVAWMAVSSIATSVGSASKRHRR